MRAIVQRVTHSSVSIDGKEVAHIEQGLNILLGVGPDDTEDNARQMAKKIAHLRIFSDEAGKMNLSVCDVQGQVIVVSQFTLYADTRRGHRPSFVGAADPDIASPLCDRFVAFLQEQGVPCQTGVFGAHMQVEIGNDGPVTILLEI
jgi:D-tyrosyl-tRNA(Tyr) deacylase